MKGEDLQLYDWVFFSGRSRYPMQVFGITESDCTLNFPGNEGDYFDGNLGEGGVCPICLTDEMLRLNGFERHEGDEYDTWTYKRESGDFSVCSDIFDFFIMLESGDRDIIIYYVHQFQHLLRLVGLKDLANNLKIK